MATFGLGDDLLGDDQDIAGLQRHAGSQQRFSHDSREFGISVLALTLDERFLTLDKCHAGSW